MYIRIEIFYDNMRNLKKWDIIKVMVISGRFIKKLLISCVFITIIFSSCLTIKTRYVVERFLEFDDIDFNHVKNINIITENKTLGKEFEKYIVKFYRNRALEIPKIIISNIEKDELSHELTFNIKKFDYQIFEGWIENSKPPVQKDNGKYLVFHNNINYWKSIDASIYVKISRNSMTYTNLDLSDDAVFSIEGESCIQKEYSELEDSLGKNAAIPSLEDFAKKNIKDIENEVLFSGIIEKFFREFFSKRLKPISKELVYFKFGFNKKFYKAQEHINNNRFDEALIIWEDIYSDLENPSFSRGIAAYNIGMVKTLIRDYESASIYFNRSEELEKIGLQELEKF
ncbi:MAG: hypothetical protein KA885_10885 [Spirochaetes bacterium]|nr:hypothetical protein [Spirochaetota bacterium]